MSKCLYQFIYAPGKISLMALLGRSKRATLQRGETRNAIECAGPSLFLMRGVMCNKFN